MKRYPWQQTFADADTLAGLQEQIAQLREAVLLLLPHAVGEAALEFACGSQDTTWRDHLVVINRALERSAP